MDSWQKYSQKIVGSAYFYELSRLFHHYFYYVPYDFFRNKVLAYIYLQPIKNPAWNSYGLHQTSLLEKLWERNLKAVKKGGGAKGMCKYMVLPLG